MSKSDKKEDKGRRRNELNWLSLVLSSNKNLSYLPTSIEDLKVRLTLPLVPSDSSLSIRTPFSHPQYITRIEPIKPYLGLASKPRRVSTGIVASSSPPTSPSASTTTITLNPTPTNGPTTAAGRPIGRTVSMPSQPSSSSSSSSSLTFTNGGAPQSLAALREASAAVDGVATPSKLGGAGRRELGRSTTVNPSLAAGGAGAKDAKGGKGSRGDLDLDLSSNKIGVLPRELFQLENLVYLSLSEWARFVRA